MYLLSPANEVCEGYVFTGVCLSTGEACMAGGHAWQWGVCGRGVCMAGGHAWRGLCMAGGHVWWEGLCGRGHAWWGRCMCSRGGTYVVGGMHGRGHAWQGACVGRACMAGGMHGNAQMPPPSRYYKIWSMSGRYASYWNAFLSLHISSFNTW